MLNFLKKAPAKTLFFVVGTLCLVGTLLAGAPIGIALLIAVGLSALLTLGILKSRKSPEPDFFGRDLEPKLPPIPTISYTNRNTQDVPPPSVTPSRSTNRTLNNQLEDIRAKSETTAPPVKHLNSNTPTEACDHQLKKKAAQQKLQEMREKFAAQEKDYENKKGALQDAHNKKMAQCAPEERAALIQSCNEKIATLDNLLQVKKEANKKAILAQEHMCGVIDSVASSQETARKYNGQ